MSFEGLKSVEFEFLNGSGEVLKRVYMRVCITGERVVSFIKKKNKAANGNAKSQYCDIQRRERRNLVNYQVALYRVYRRMHLAQVLKGRLCPLYTRVCIEAQVRLT